jgi:hypothetical protein
MLTWLLIALIVFTLIVTYLFWIRPILKTKPSFATYYAREGSVWAALDIKFSGLKQKATTALVLVIGFVVSAYDAIVSFAAQAGFDWGHITTLSSKVPSWAWPLIGMALIKLVQYFRDLQDKRTAEVLVAKGIDPIVVKE